MHKSRKGVTIICMVSLVILAVCLYIIKINSGTILFAGEKDKDKDEGEKDDEKSETGAEHTDPL